MHAAPENSEAILLLLFSVSCWQTPNARFTALELHALVTITTFTLYYVPASGVKLLLQDVLHDYVHAAFRDWIVSQLFLDGIYWPVCAAAFQRTETLCIILRFNYR
jgi:hypothetical protein